MSHIFFFSYARGDQDPYLDEFFNDRCVEVAGPTQFKPDDTHVAFRDTKDLPLMDNWRTHIEGALQSSAVLV